MRALITGASGFAGGYLASCCTEHGDEVIGVSRTGAIPAGAGEGRALDLGDAEAVRACLAEVRPEVVYHLAALSSVGRSWEDPGQTIHENVTSAVNVLEAVRREAPMARMVWVSSCEVYGAPATLPLFEDAPVSPANPYAVSKATGDLLAAVYADAHRLDVIRVRPFSHAGPGQRPIFIVSSLAQQAAEAQLRGAAELEIRTGNPDTRRDFTDVRDIARAYRLLAERGEAGVYNVCSGRSVSAAEQVALIGELVAPIAVEHAVDPDRIRPHEVMDLRGSHERVTAATGWRPEIPFHQTVADTIAWWEHELADPAATDAVRG